MDIHDDSERSLASLARAYPISSVYVSERAICTANATLFYLESLIEEN